MLRDQCVAVTIGYMYRAVSNLAPVWFVVLFASIIHLAQWTKAQPPGIAFQVLEGLISMTNDSSNDDAYSDMETCHKLLRRYELSTQTVGMIHMCYHFTYKISVI